MTEREIVAGILAGRLKLRDVAHIDERGFEDWIMANIFCVAVGCLERGAIPKSDRIAKVLQQFPSTNIDGLGALVDKLREEGRSWPG